MEGFALALGAAALSLPFAEIRSVSNQAGCRPPHTWDFDAAEHALSLAAQDIFEPLFKM
jgi:futalosine hydrolase